MNSASTFMYSINEILKYQPKEIQVAVLIERYYKSFPITPNFRGLELSTSKSEHVQVDLGNSPKVLIL
jgi:pyrimidine operon attenuation protein/uracil phosphoribosyltransferase